MKTIRKELQGHMIAMALAMSVACPVLAREAPRDDGERVQQREDVQQQREKASKAQAHKAEAPPLRAPAVRQDQDQGRRQHQTFAPNRPNPRAMEVRQREESQARKAVRQAEQVRANPQRQVEQQRVNDARQRNRELANSQAVQRRALEQRKAEQARANQQRQAEQQRLDAARQRNRELADTQAAQRRALEQRQTEQRLNEQREARRDQQQTQEAARRQARLSERERQRLISLQQQRAAEYRRYLVARQNAERQRILTLQQQRRMQQYRYQQWYWQRQQDMQANWAAQRYSYDNDPYYYTPASYRYYRTGRSYDVNRYAADLLQQAVRYGYQEGVRAGRADRYDGWRNDYRQNYAYTDANYGYHGYYVNQSEYNHYFREGFSRGYEDAYGRDYRYGNYDGGSYSILASVLQAILNLQPFS